jgi:hypothetical protein
MLLKFMMTLDPSIELSNMDVIGKNDGDLHPIAPMCMMLLNSNTRFQNQASDFDQFI